MKGIVWWEWVLTCLVGIAGGIMGYVVFGWLGLSIGVVVCGGLVFLVCLWNEYGIEGEKGRMERACEMRELFDDME